ncbi:hypothetical protein DP113_22780 [Brasilonema octagenarum UFV-E1]|uniref:Uncharacterized protein n=2 Tax=Brasilonema TaxID=383614 RepID=A0A856MJK8_9CYAN|nr:hypothetical protein [Brasilonema octagenarum UFV-OR1]QDL10360.1 hypothetical protein DP114_22875 [Brasilonema sennae CENA114]QDL16707.1 hypothetical protein DP113_22780 [Brasilonema octagenarum UFV-E1]
MASSAWSITRAILSRFSTPFKSSSRGNILNSYQLSVISYQLSSYNLAVINYSYQFSLFTVN